MNPCLNWHIKHSPRPWRVRHTLWAVPSGQMQNENDGSIFTRWSWLQLMIASYSNWWMVSPSRRQTFLHMREAAPRFFNRSLGNKNTVVSNLGFLAWLIRPLCWHSETGQSISISARDIQYPANWFTSIVRQRRLSTHRKILRTPKL
jgi:hypothetical protein